jgi:hypothetical protein
MHLWDALFVTLGCAFGSVAVFRPAWMGRDWQWKFVPMTDSQKEFRRTCGTMMIGASAAIASDHTFLQTSFLLIAGIGFVAWLIEKARKPN